MPQDPEDPAWPRTADRARSSSPSDPEALTVPEQGIPPELVQARATIDNIDAALIHILAERFRCTQSVGHIKARFDLPPADPAREHQQVVRMRKLAEESGLDPDFAEKFLSFMVTEVIRHHEDIKQAYRRGESTES